MKNGEKTAKGIHAHTIKSPLIRFFVALLFSFWLNASIWIGLFCFDAGLKYLAWWWNTVKTKRNKTHFESSKFHDWPLT